MALAFECSPEGYRVRINSSDFLAIAQTGTSDIDSAFSVHAGLSWNTDDSDGDPDSTAIGDWVQFDNGTSSYSKQVYLLGKYDGISHSIQYKLQFIYVDEFSYRMIIADPFEEGADTLSIIKDPKVNSIQYSVESKQVMQLEPFKDEWDVLFCQYHTILFTDDGIAAPYYVRGVLLNPNHVEAALDTTVRFEQVDYEYAMIQEFSGTQDAIGHDWKSVEVDEGSNSAEYKVRPGYSYIIRDTDNVYYKFRFKSYFNQLGEKGYPKFEYARLSPED